MQPTRSSQVLFKNEQECIIRFKNSRRSKNELIYIRDFEAVQKTRSCVLQAVKTLGFASVSECNSSNFLAVRLPLLSVQIIS